MDKLLTTLLVDTEESRQSVQDLIDARTVDWIDARRFNAVESAYRELWAKTIVADVVVVDTITTLATTTRQDLIIDPASSGGVAPLWDNRLNLKTKIGDWGDMSDLLNRMLRAYRELPQITVFCCHEGERTDPTATTSIEKRGPDLNAAVLRDVIAWSDAVIRVSVLGQTIEVDGETYGPETRCLRLKPSASAMAKTRAALGRPYPEILFVRETDNALRKLEAALGYLPKKITLYGPSGAGKTTTATSLSRPTQSTGE